jgi:hypothetical protein
MMRRIGFLLVLCLLCGFAAAAQDKADAYFGYVYTRQTYGSIDSSFNMNGGIGQFAYYPNSWFGLVGEFGVSTVRHIDGALVNTGATLTFLGGPRVTFRHGPLQPYVQGLLGGAHMDSTMQADLGVAKGGGIAMALGGGVDLKLSSHIAFRLGQFDYFLTRLVNPTSVPFTQDNFRYSTGLVVRF